MPEQMVAASCGLMARTGTPVPLTGVSVRADLRALCGRVTVAQRYRNTESQPLEAVYLFPLDEGAAVCGFEAVIDGRTIVGRVEEREEAFRVYDDAMSAGHGGYLLDEERPDVFQASVGNLRPGAEVQLTVTYVVELDAVDDGVRFVVPTTVSPRYAPAQDRRGVGRPDADTLNPPRQFDVPYGLDVRVTVRAPQRPSRIGSVSHPVDVAWEGDVAIVSLSRQDAALDRDFVLTVEGGGFDEPSASVESGPGSERAVAISFVPRFEEERRGAEVVFVVDRSGSMAGSSIAEVRNALQLCLRSLTLGCRFNIVGFGTGVRRLFETNRPYDEESLALATAHVQTLEADLGGTEILRPLRETFEATLEHGAVRQVIVLTDGQVTNTDEVLELVKRHAASHRVFTVGIGAGTSAHLVKGIARAGGGTAEFIAPGERIESKVLRLVTRVLSPAMTDVRVEWRGLDVTQAPATAPAVFSGSRTVIYGFVKHDGRGVVRLSGKGPHGSLSFDVPVDTSTAAAGSVIGTLAARARIRELEESPEWTLPRASRQARPRPSNAVTEIIELAKRYGLVSRETSYVAIEEREDAAPADAQLRRIPIALTNGWGGMDRMEATTAMWMLDPGLPVADADTFDASAPGPMRLSVARSAAQPGDRALRPAVPMAPVGGAPGRPGRAIGSILSAVTGPFRRGGADDSLRDRVLALVTLQRADGTWKASQDVTDAIAMSHEVFLETYNHTLSSLGLTHTNATVDAWATAIACAWLENRAAGLEQEWRMVASKGRRALETLLTGPNAEAFLAAARTLV
jgi:Ca-activated chloride channel family protein